MKRLWLVALCGLTVCHLGATQESAWRGENDEPVENSSAGKSPDEFGGFLVITPDADWQEKWNIPQGTIPHFTISAEVDFGKTLTILTFFTNPMVDVKGKIQILCDIRVIRPDGSYSVNVKDMACADEDLDGDPNNLRLTTAVMNFVGETDDPPGEWSVEIDLKDKLSGAVVPLKSSFILRARK